MSVDELKQCLHREVIGHNKKPFSWGKAIHSAYKKPKKRFVFWWRLANFLYLSKSRYRQKLAKRINRNLFFKYNTEIELGTQIGAGLTIGHQAGIVISRRCKIGENFTIRQNTTIGLKSDNSNTITIGNNVNIGANSCIISEHIVIGDNVTIGAGAFVNHDIPANSTYYSVNHYCIRPKE
ncbi:MULTISPECIES: serine acetyltransferase [Rosenbergiella]|uniref:serine acetyltransferase n=1 Tax=Rosenbergiella TaxID=1356488 RepID=UPI001BDA8532|nr:MULTISPECIES: DapH/DapD/GlmU-related protein [Rosenbergiella]MBT0721788.1 serine acetyltransferase [Rosenbergiella collisarenosi]